jgi:ATP-dependent RNA helicase SUPV3L1/SUV3
LFIGASGSDPDPDALAAFFWRLTVTSSSKPVDFQALDQLTGGVFTAATSGDRSARLRDWLLTEPSVEQMNEVYHELSSRDKGAAKALREKLDEVKRSRGQEALAADWATRAEQLLQAPRLNIADALAWQRDAAKAGAPLSREPLASLKLRLTDVVKRVEDLQHQAMVQREAAVLLAQRIEVHSTKPMAEAEAAQAALQADVAHWLSQAQALTQDAVWPSVDLKFPAQVEMAQSQLQAVWDSFSAALQQALLALTDAQAALPSVPVWSDEIRRARGEVVAVDAAPAADKPAKVAKPKMDAAQRQALREEATKAVLLVLEAVEKSVTEGAIAPDAADSLHQVLKVHGKNLDTAVDSRVHEALIAAGDAQGWQRWVTDQHRQELVTKAEALLGADKTPAMGGRKMQESLRQLREAWKQTDQGGLPNHGLWKRFDTACNEAYQTVQAWLANAKQESAAHKAQRVALMDEVKAWTEAHVDNSDWRMQVRTLHQFSDRWRNAGHLNEKAFAEMQAQWKALIHAAAARLDVAQKASIERRQALIAEAKALGEAPGLRVDAVKALQQRWQTEAQSVPLDRKTEQKLWEVFRKPIDEAFERKGSERSQSNAPLTAHDRAVIDASKALEAANAKGDAGAIRAAMFALEAALKGQAEEASQMVAAAKAPESVAPAALADEATAQVSEDAGTDGTAAQADESIDSGDEPTQAPAPVAAPKPAKPVVAVRGDDRPGQKKTEPASASKPGRRDGRPGERGAERGGDRFARPERGERRDFRDERREDRGPRLGDEAFRAQREARERAEMALRKLAAQAHGETLTRILGAWQERQAEALPTVQELGKSVNAAARQAWSQAVGQPAGDAAGTSLIRLEMAAEVPTPAEYINDRRALQLQLLTRRNEPGPLDTWARDVTAVLSGPHDPASARRLQNVLKQLLRS